MDEYFLWDVDAAFVVDRRGKGDVVTSCGGYLPFCNEAFGRCIEEIAAKTTNVKWACTAGGSSDTRIWAAHGIQSVNLSVGYQHEHTDNETLDVGVCYQTVELLEGIFEYARDVRAIVRRDRLQGNVRERYSGECCFTLADLQEGYEVIQNMRFLLN